MPVTGPMFKYFGSKWRLSKYYPAPRYETIVEPFAGSACYSLRHYSKRVKLFDADPKTIRLWQYIIGGIQPDLPMVSPGDMIMTENFPQISDAECELIAMWQRVGAVSHSRKASNWTGSPGLWSLSTLRRISKESRELSHWQASCCDWTEVPKFKATWFIDPPYQLQSPNVYRARKSIEYHTLGEWVRSLPGQVIVCEQLGADWLPFHVFRDSKSTRTNKSHTEVIWTNDAND